MNRELLVYVDLDDVPHLVGRLWSRDRQGRQSASFEYDKTWLMHPQKFSLEPTLSVGPGPFHTVPNRTLFGSIGDSAPDRWGRALMKRAELRAAITENRAPRTLLEIDFLLGVSDRSRQGALRFAAKRGGPFLTEDSSTSIPPEVKLPRLLAASDAVIDGDDDEELLLLLAPGSSLGGARPKASIFDVKGDLAIAKFPSKEDEYQVIVWEAVALSLAVRAKIRVAAWRLHTVGRRSVLVLKRFDRSGFRRIPYISAMSMLGAADGETRCYLEFVDALRQHGANPKRDMEELWRRIVFNVLISNTDDHLRNHGFLYAGPAGWTLSPAFDLNPVPLDMKPRILSTEIQTGDATASLDLALSVAEYFHISGARAHEIVSEVQASVRGWKQAAEKLGITKSEVARMASAFEHEDST